MEPNELIQAIRDGDYDASLRELESAVAGRKVVNVRTLDPPDTKTMTMDDAIPAWNAWLDEITVAKERGWLNGNLLAQVQRGGLEIHAQLLRWVRDDAAKFKTAGGDVVVTRLLNLVFDHA